MEKKENKTMKKGLTIAALALLLGVVGYTGGQTFAKYVAETGHETESATVAKWGIVLTAQGELFSDEYGVSSSTLATKDGTTLVVDSVASAKVVAPGTTGSMTLTVSGAPEVNYEVTYTKKADCKDIFVPANTVAGVDKDYYPIIWTVNNGSTSKEFNQIADVHTYLGQQLHSGEVIAANVAIGNPTTYTISWAWAFDGAYNFNGTKFTADQVDELDTYLGNQNALQQVAFGFDLTVQQSQEEATYTG